MNFMMLPDRWSNEDSEVYILPIEYEGDVCRGQGASKGAEEIIKASCDVEPYDEQFDLDGFEKGIHTLPILTFSDEDHDEAMKKISEKVKGLRDKFVISIGGSHTVTEGITNGYEGTFSVLVLDAHPDLRKSWGTEHSHACTSRKVAKEHKIGLLGIRAMDIEEKDYIEKKRIPIIKSYDYEKRKLKSLLSELDQDVFLSIDVDVFDPTLIRNTGTPEPDGLNWREIIEILVEIFKNKNVIGCDLVEFAPKNNYEDEAYFLAKLVYKLIILHHKTFK